MLGGELAHQWRDVRALGGGRLGIRRGRGRCLRYRCGRRRSRRWRRGGRLGGRAGPPAGRAPAAAGRAPAAARAALGRPRAERRPAAAGTPRPGERRTRARPRGRRTRLRAPHCTASCTRARPGGTAAPPGGGHLVGRGRRGVLRRRGLGHRVRVAGRLRDGLRGRRPGRPGLAAGHRAGTVRGVVDDRELGADRDRLVLGDRDAAQDAGGRGGDLGVHLVGGDFEQRFVRLYALAFLLEPARDGALGDALAELGHGYRDRHGLS